MKPLSLRALWIVLAVAGLSCRSISAAPSVEPKSPVDSVRQAVTEWSKLRAETVRLETNWESERQLLNSTLKAERERAQALVTQKTSLEAKNAGERDSLAAIGAQNAAAEAAINSASEHLSKIVAELLALRPKLPPRLSQALELPYRSLANPALSPGERMQFVTTILNRCAQFNKVITYGDEPLTLPGDTDRRMLEVIYWGASHAYALDRVGGKAFLGAPGAQGWNWEPARGAEKSVAQLIAIYRDKSDPQFIEAPAQISKALANESSNR